MPLVYETLDETVRNRNSAKIYVTFTDESGLPVTPATVQWSLMARDETIINSRDSVTYTTLATGALFGLSPDDNDYEDGRVRYFLVEAWYNSTLGTSLELKKAARYNIVDIPGVT